VYRHIFSANFFLSLSVQVPVVGYGSLVFLIEALCCTSTGNVIMYPLFSGPLATFLDYITYGYMIDNIVLLITGFKSNFFEIVTGTYTGILFLTCD
jgi:hypothetical protein